MPVTGNLSISPTLLPVGQTTTSALTGLSSNFTATISINRTGQGSHPWLDTLDSTTTFDLLIQSSPDGVTWDNEVEANTVGGVLTNRNGTVATFDVQVNGLNPGATQVRGVVTIGGSSSVEVSGSISTS